MKSGYTHISLVVDRSGSMHSIRSDAEGSINSLIDDQAKVEGEATVTLYEFDDQFNKVFGPVHVAAAPQYVLTPRGSTALRDATYRSIQDTGDFLRNLPEADRPERVVFVVVTDGMENCSKETTNAQVKSLIEQQTNQYNWEFLYIGAGTDVFDKASEIGISSAFAYTPTAKGTRAMYGVLNDAISTARYAGGSVASNMAPLSEEAVS